MSVVVRMEMPSNCERCPMCGTASGGNGMYKLWCMCGDIPASSQRRPDDCPIICSLPEGHGRLVDGDELYTTVKAHDTKRIVNLVLRSGFIEEKNICLYDICQAKTIVPAEAERSET